LLAGAAAAQTPPGALTLHLGVIPSEVAGEAFYGTEMGFYKRAGLDVQIETFNNGSAIAAAIAGGSLDVGLSDLVSVISAHAHGLPFVYVAPGLLTTLKAPTYGLIVPDGSPIRAAKDLDGKNVAVSGLHNIAQIGASAWIDANGGDAKTVKFVEVPFPTLIPALAQGRIDAAMGNEPWMTLASDSGDHLIFLEKNALAPAFLLSGWVTTRDWVARNPAAAAKFVAVTREIARWANRNPDASAPILSKYTKIPPAVIARMHRGEFAERFDAANVQPVIEAAAKYGVIASPFPAAEIFAAK
jgi:NitT/TauT family transport system substrate-binding protein